MKNIRYYALFWALAISVVFVMLTGGGLKTRQESWLEAAMAHSETMLRQEEKPEPATLPETEPITQETTEPEPETTEVTAEAVTEPVEETVPESTGPLAVYGEDESYFDDALFIGDSRTDGLRLYSPIGEASYFCTTGMTVFDVFKTVAPNRELVEQTLEEVLEERQFGKIYITLALNELSEKDIVLKAEFQMVLNRLRRMQPEAKLILHGIMPLGKEKAASQSYFSMERIGQINGLLESIAQEQGCYYLDASSVFAGEDGYLREELSFDGCHLYARNYWMWAQFLCENAV